MSAVPEVYPQIRGMFEKALRGMAEGETEAEKQIVYVLNEARAALPCPSFLAVSSLREWSLRVLLGPKAVDIVSASVSADAGHFIVAPFAGQVSGALALAAAVIGALRDNHVVIMQAAMEAGPKVMPAEQWPALSDDFMAQADAAQRRIRGFAGVSPGPAREPLGQERTDDIAHLMAYGLYRGADTISALATKWGVPQDVVREHARAAALQWVG